MQNFAIWGLMAFVCAELIKVYEERSKLLEESQTARYQMRCDAEYYRSSAFASAADCDALRKELSVSENGEYEEADYTVMGPAGPPGPMGPRGPKGDPPGQEYLE